MERKSISSNQSGRYSQQSPESVDRMKDHLSHNIIVDIDLNSPGVVTKLDLLLRKNKISKTFLCGMFPVSALKRKTLP
ncbi:hypothetical protein J4V80_17115, partial [Escherichia coli]